MDRIGRNLIRRRTIYLAASAGLVLLLLWASSVWSDLEGRRQAAALADSAARSNVLLIRSEVEKFRLLSGVLARNSNVRATVDDPAPARTVRLNAELKALSQRTGAAVIYLLDRTGRTIAAGNLRERTSFIGNDYSYRSYFRDALANGAGEQFALGIGTRKAGLFLAERVRSDAGVGVIVVKMEADTLERDWQSQSAETIVTNADGVVLLSSVPDWRFNTSRPLSRTRRAALSHGLQFGGMALPPLPLAETEAGVMSSTAVLSDRREQWVVSRRAAPVASWTLWALEPLEPALTSARAQARVFVLSIIVALVVILAFVFRAMEAADMRSRAQQRLEQEVEARTRELREANIQLRDNAVEREQVTARYRAAREEVAQSNRLGVLGQITAGVAHEINQPIAAIRTFAENAISFLDRGSGETVRANLHTIVDLTDRVGSITAELRSFTRRRQASPAPVALASAIDGALLLIGDRLRNERVALTSTGDWDLRVIAERVGLEQILINLMQNAVDALAGQEDRRVTLHACREDAQVCVAVSDNGPGIAPEAADQLFIPFFTGKGDGLGLGLGISRDIARSFGGELVHRASAAGALLVLMLPGAD